MACVTVGLKRPLEFDPVHSPPNHNNKRRRFIPGILSPNRSLNVNVGSPGPSSSCSFATPSKKPSPFGEVESKITTEEIACSIRDEIKRLQRRKQLPTSPFYKPGSPTSENHGMGSSSPEHMGCKSPPHTMMTLDSPVHSPPYPTHDLLGHCDLSVPKGVNKDKPIFTMRQVGMLCERLLREKESVIRSEYDQVLSAKLAEQYDAFVKFTYEQIQQKFESATAPSYLS